MFARVLLLTSLVAVADAFTVAFLSSSRISLMQAKAPDADAVDFDAPLDRLAAVGDIVRSESDDPLRMLDHEIVVDDENSVYHGKDGSIDEVDFDPIHNPKPTKQHSDERTDFDAPLWRLKEVGDIVSSGETVGLDHMLDHEIVVDDENSVYHGKDGSIDEVDFDPMH